MKPNDLSRISPEGFMVFVIAHFKHQRNPIEEGRPAPAGQLLLFRLDEALYVVYYLHNTPLFGPISDVMSVEIAWGIKAAENLTAACGYVIARSRLSFPKVVLNFQ